MIKTYDCQQARGQYTQGAPPHNQSSLLQELIYRVQHLAAIRLERHRMGRPPAELQDTYAQISEALTLLQ